MIEALIESLKYFFEQFNFEKIGRLKENNEQFAGIQRVKQSIAVKTTNNNNASILSISILVLL